MTAGLVGWPYHFQSDYNIRIAGGQGFAGIASLRRVCVRVLPGGTREQCHCRLCDVHVRHLDHERREIATKGTKAAWSDMRWHDRPLLFVLFVAFCAFVIQPPHDSTQNLDALPVPKTLDMWPKMW